LSTDAIETTTYSKYSLSSMIQFSNYQKYFGPQLIVDIPALDLAQGIYWLKGENGSGKTTLIKSIAGLIPFEGNISVAATDIKQNRTKYRDIVNYAEAEPLYPSFLTGSDLVRFYTKTKKASDQQVATLIKSFGVQDYIDNKIGTYSSGMAKKLSLVLGFIGNPTLILLDEPLITLDVASVKTLQDLIVEHYSAGASFLVTSHQDLLNGLIAKMAQEPGGNATQPVVHQFRKLTFTRLT